MKLANEILSHILDWSPALLVLVVGSVVVRTVGKLIRGHYQGRPGVSLPVLVPVVTLALSGIVVVAFILAMPLGSEEHGQLLSLFGLLVTAAIALSSTTVLGNAMAGIMLRSLRSFRPGDYLRVGDFAGRVSAQGLLHTEIQTEDRDLCTFPNLYLVTHPVTVLYAEGTVVSATVSLGYGIHHSDVEAILIGAVRDSGLSDPFVQVEELGDYAITYRAAGILREVKQLLSARSEIRRSMLDALHKAGIEIVSPTFMNQRNITDQGHFIPEEGRPRKRQLNAVPPEARIFEKAEEAEARSRLSDEIGEQERRIKALEENLESSAITEERANFESQLQSARERLEAMRSALNEEPEK